MPCHNAERTLAQAIQSVAAQTYTRWELVVVDDGSTDRSTAILHDMAAADPRIRVIRNERASGASAARNAALADTRCRYVAFLDSDDAWAPRKLEVQLREMEAHGAALSCGWYDVMDGEGNITGEVRPKAGTLAYRDILGNNPVGTLTAMLDRSLCGDVRFNTQLPKSEDYYLWLSILKRGLPGICIGEVLGVYRVHGNTLSSNKLSAAKNRWRVYREFEGYGLLPSALYLAVYAVTGALKMIFMRQRRLRPPQ
jgi:teichuronic acid biosynthesis glycosyltransferase TuaG